MQQKKGCEIQRSFAFSSVTTAAAAAVWEIIYDLKKFHLNILLEIVINGDLAEGKEEKEREGVSKIFKRKRQLFYVRVTRRARREKEDMLKKLVAANNKWRREDRKEKKKEKPFFS